MGGGGRCGRILYFRKPVSSVISLWDANGVVTQAIGQQLAWIRPRADAADDNLAFTVRDTAGTPHVWLYGHGGRSGGHPPHRRSSPVWIKRAPAFYFEKRPLRTHHRPGPSPPPHRKALTFQTAPPAERRPRIDAPERGADREVTEPSDRHRHDPGQADRLPEPGHRPDG